MPSINSDTNLTIHYQISQINTVRQTVSVKTSLSLEDVRAGKLQCPLFPRHPIIVEDISPAKRANSQYVVSFRHLTPHGNYPPSILYGGMQASFSPCGLF
jgi:hypothetical protein